MCKSKLSNRDRERLTLVWLGVSDLAHDLNKCQREAVRMLEEQMASVDPPMRARLADAYDEVVRTSAASKRDLELCEEGIMELLRC